MGDAVIAFRPLTGADVSGLATVFADSFDDDPPFVWALPDVHSRRRRLRRIFHTMLGRESHGGVEVACEDGRVVGGALWQPPDHWNESVLRQLASMPGFLRGFGRRITYGQTRQRTALRAFRLSAHRQAALARRCA